MQNATPAAPAWTTTLDIAALVAALTWPLLIVVGLWLFRDRLVEAARAFAPLIKSVSIGIVSFEFAEARPLPLQMAGAVDLRHAGQSGDVNDSTLRSFYDQIQDPSRLDYAVVDLGTGQEWLSSRLFILSVILARMRGLRALVFVETAGHVRRRLVGVAECDKVRWRLAMRFPWMESALAHAEASVWPPLMPPPGLAIPPEPVISTDDGRLEYGVGDPEPAATILRNYLDEIQLDLAPPAPTPGWEILPGSSPPRIEHAQWLTAPDIEQILGPTLNQASIGVAELRRDDAVGARLLVLEAGRWVALTRDDRVFDRLIDRMGILETVAQRAVKTSG